MEFLYSVNAGNLKKEESMKFGSLFCVLCLVGLVAGCSDDGGDSSSITAVTAGEGLEGGGSEGEVTLSADTGYLQARVQNSCTGNSAMQAIGSTGNVSCSAEMALASHDHEGMYAAVEHNHDDDYAALDHNHDGLYAPMSHNHDATYAALAHDHDDRYVTKPAFTGHNNDSCDDDTGYLIIGNIQEEFGCNLDCDTVCERHGMVCERVYSVGGTLGSCSSNSNSAALYCWCRG